MSPLVEMLPLLNRDWKVRFLMRSKRGILTLGRTVFYGSGGEGCPTRDAPTGEGVGRVELRTTGFFAALRMTCCTPLNDRSGWTQGLELHLGWRR